VSQEAGPTLFGWCEQAARVDAFAATLADLVNPDALCSMSIESLSRRDDNVRRDISVAEAIAMVRAGFSAGTCAHSSFATPLRAVEWIWPIFYCNGDDYERVNPSGPLQISLGDRKDVFPQRLDSAIDAGDRVLEVEAAIAAMQVQEDVESLLVRLCAPDASKRVITGAYTDLWFWTAPVEACATYHVNPGEVARDLALSWIHLHDGDRVEHLAGLSMDALRARVESAPRGAHAAVALNTHRVIEHIMQERAAGRIKHERHGRTSMLGDVALSREAVLSALSVSGGALLDAVEASALPDDEWRTVESSALETIEAMKASVPAHQVNVTTRKHVQFIERHAPYRVRRLPGGAVILATHPNRTLWQLYADALSLLGIMPS
jgi:hypothetical protein